MAVSQSMDISAVTPALLRHIDNQSTQTGDAVTVSVMRKAMDIQSQQAAALIESAAQAVPRPQAGPGQLIDVHA